MQVENHLLLAVFLFFYAKCACRKSRAFFVQIAHTEKFSDNDKKDVKMLKKVNINYILC